MLARCWSRVKGYYQGGHRKVMQGRDRTQKNCTLLGQEEAWQINKKKTDNSLKNTKGQERQRTLKEMIDREKDTDIDTHIKNNNKLDRERKIAQKEMTDREKDTSRKNRERCGRERKRTRGERG